MPATGVVMGLTAALNPFILHEAYDPFARRLWRKVQPLRDPTARQKLLVEEHAWIPRTSLCTSSGPFYKMFPMAETPNYEPPPEASVAAVRRRWGSPRKLPSGFVGAKGRLLCSISPS